MPGENNILENRNKINDIDKQILDLLNERAELSLYVTEQFSIPSGNLLSTNNVLG